MSQGKTYARDKALPVAKQVAKMLLNDPLRCCIVGSLRRGHDRVGDVDIVVTDCQEFQTAWLLAHAEWGIERFGPKYRRVVVQKLPIDIYIAKDAVQFAMLKLVRTGSTEHNIFLVQTAKARGLAFKAGEGLYRDGQRLNLPTEELIFQSLGMDYKAPVDREYAPSNSQPRSGARRAS